MRELAQGPPFVTTLKFFHSLCHRIFKKQYFNFFYLSTSYIKHFIYLLLMSLFDLNNDVRYFFSRHLSNDYKSSTISMSKHYDLQKSLFGEIVFDDDFH